MKTVPAKHIMRSGKDLSCHCSKGTGIGSHFSSQIETQPMLATRKRSEGHLKVQKVLAQARSAIQTILSKAISGLYIIDRLFHISRLRRDSKPDINSIESPVPHTVLDGKAIVSGAEIDGDSRGIISQISTRSRQKILTIPCAAVSCPGQDSYPGSILHRHDIPVISYE